MVIKSVAAFYGCENVVASGMGMNVVIKGLLGFSEMRGLLFSTSQEISISIFDCVNTVWDYIS